MPTNKSKHLVATIAAVVLLAIASFFNLTGFYLKAPRWDAETLVQKYPGETLWYFRRGTNFGFINSSDNIAITAGFSPNAEIRAKLDAEFDRHASGRILARFAFSRALYLQSTDTTDWYTPPELEKK